MSPNHGNFVKRLLSIRLNYREALRLLHESEPFGFFFANLARELSAQEVDDFDMNPPKPV